MSVPPFDLDAELARIRRGRAESDKLREDTRAQRERDARAAARERWLAPLVAIIAIVGGTLGFASFLLSLSGH